jgi:exodeoxyribonuclease V alpha subunit
VANAHRINSGKSPEFNGKDFFFIERKEPSKVLETVLEIVTKRLPQRFNLDPVRDVQVLAPMHRGEAGVANLNTALQTALNPEGAPVLRRGFRIGDKVMQTRNNYELEVFNGDVGVVSRADDETKHLYVDFDDRAVAYPYEDLDNLSLAYAMTVHKAQGSEYPAVVIPLVTQHYLMLQRNVLYTAITRGRRLVILVGHPKALYRAVHNTDVARRHTRLTDRLRHINSSEFSV